MQIRLLGTVDVDLDDLIAGPRTTLLRALTEDSEAAAELRKESPFTTLLAPDERKRVLQRLAS